VSSKLSQPWIPLDRVERLVQLEPMLACIGLALGAWLIYRTLLRGVSRQRHENLTRLFKNLLIHTAIMITLFSAFFAISFVEPQTAAQGAALNRLMAYVGLGTLLSGVTVFVKVCRILFFEYLFLTHMRVAVPLLLVNICTLLLSLVLGSWLLTEIFDIRLGPLLATSAVFSLVVGLALQDTLGNLFSGVALQLDEPYQIGDWIEVNSGSQKWVGLVDEISWRATVLIGWLDETITIPNRVMGQAQISNFSTKLRPIARSQAFKIAHGSSLESARRALLEAPLRVPGVRRNPSPSVIITEANESWLVFKLVYFIDDYGAQYTVADQIIAAAIHELDKAQVTLASPRIEVTTTHAA
jgi:small-conductance mechanosensitive channel